MRLLAHVRPPVGSRPLVHPRPLAPPASSVPATAAPTSAPPVGAAPAGRGTAGDRPPRSAAPVAGSGALRRASRRAVPVLAGLATTAVLVVAGAGAASAHDEVRSTTPAAEASVDQAPAEVSLQLSAPALSQGTVLAVLAPDGTDLVDGAPVLVDDTVTQPLVADRPAGTYTVQWRVTSADGHPISGTFTFDAAAATAAAPPATSSTATPSASSEPTAPTSTGGTEEPTASATSSSSEPEMTTMASEGTGEEGDPPLSGTAGTLLAGAAALAALVGAGVALVRMRRRD